MAPGIAEKKSNSLPMWGNEKTMNLNNLILTNILSSHYFKVNLYQLKTYHEVIDEIYYQVTHLEPWEKGSRKASGQTGMCGGVRGVGAGGIVSTAFCILYKLFTLKLTRKQLVGLINHSDSPYIRALGFMYIRYTQPPADLWDWFENYLSDLEELDVKAGSGQTMTIGEMLRHFLSKLEWFSTLFPRIPVPIQKDLERKLGNWRAQPENRSLLEGTSESAEVNEQHNEEDWNGASTSHRGTQHHENSDGCANVEREAIAKDFSEEIVKEKERQRRDKDRNVSSSSSRYHASEHHGRQRDRSRSPRRHADTKSGKNDHGRRLKKSHHDRSGDGSSERNKYRHSKEGKPSGDSAEGKHYKDRERHHEYDRKYHDYDRKTAHSHKHIHGRHSEKPSHSRNRDHY